MIALRHLRKAVRGAATLPSGRSHLLRVSVLAPVVAGDALRDGDRGAFREAVATADEARTLRGDVLDEMSIDLEHDANLGQLLDLGRATVEAAARVVWGGDDPAAARQLLATYRAALPESRLGPVLEALLEP